MAYIDLYPATAFVSGGTSTWSGLSNIASADLQYAICSSGSTSKLFINFYSPAHNNSLLPSNATIDGIQIFYTARVSGGTNGQLLFSYYVNNSNTAVTSGIRSATLTNTPTVSSVGHATEKFNFPIQWIDINTYQNTNKTGCVNFGAVVSPASSYSVPIWIDEIYLRVHYTESSYLTGARGKFHYNRPDLGFSVAISGDSWISRKENGAQPVNQIQSFAVNQIGDALYNIESAIISSSGSVYALDLEKTYVFSIMVSALCDSADTTTDALLHGKIRYQGSNVTNTVNMYSLKRTVAPHISGTIPCYWTSAIGWIEQAGIVRPLYVSTQAARFAKVNSGIDFLVGITALPSSLGTFEDYNTYEAVTGAYQNYNGTYFTAAPSSGKVFFKIMAMGREV